MRQRRVVYLDHCGLLSGAELALARLLPALSDVDPIVVLAEDGPLVPALQAGGARVEIIPLEETTRALRKDAVVPGIGTLRAGAATVGYAIRLARWLGRVSPDLVVTNSLKAAIYGSIAARIARVPVLWHVHDRLAEDYLPRPAVLGLRQAARWLPSGIIANSEATLATLRLPGDARRPATRVIGNVCPLAGQHPPDRSAHDGPLVAGMVGRLAPWKGQDVFLRAFARAFPAGGQRAVVVGDALFGEHEYATGLHRLANRLGIAERVRFTGFVADPWEEMAAFDVLVHASVVPEPFGQVVVEGMAVGCCVVATGVGGPAEIVTDGVDGLLVPPGDDKRLAEVLGRLERDTRLRHALQQAGPPSVRRFSATNIAAQEQAAYDALLRGIHRPVSTAPSPESC